MAALNQYDNNVNRRDCNLGRGRMMSQTRPCRGSETTYYYRTCRMKYTYFCILRSASNCRRKNQVFVKKTYINYIYITLDRLTSFIYNIKIETLGKIPTVIRIVSVKYLPR